MTMVNLGWDLFCVYSELDIDRYKLQFSSASLSSSHPRVSGTFFLYTSINAFALLFISILVPETKGRTLEEIQESLQGYVH